MESSLSEIDSKRMLMRALRRASTIASNRWSSGVEPLVDFAETTVHLLFELRDGHTF